MMEWNETLMTERYELAIGRIREIASQEEAEVSCEFLAYFTDAAGFLVKMDETLKKAVSGELFSADISEKREWNYSLYEEVLDGNYDTSFCNPAYAVAKLGNEYGTFLSALRAELRSLIAYVYEQKLFFVLIRMELFLEIYAMFVLANQDKQQPDIKELKEVYASFAFDYQEEFMEEAVCASFTTHNDFALRLVREADFSKSDYLYDYGEYISENECRMAAFINSLPQETIQLIADTFTEGYRKGFEATGKDTILLFTA